MICVNLIDYKSVDELFRTLDLTRNLPVFTWDSTQYLRAKTWNLLVTCKTTTLSHLWMCHDSEPNQWGQTLFRRFKVSHLKTEYLTHSVNPCSKGVRLHLLTDEATLRHSHISDDQSQSPGVLHQLSDTWICSLPTLFMSCSCWCRALPRNPQFTLRHSQ